MKPEEIAAAFQAPESLLGPLGPSGVIWSDVALTKKQRDEIRRAFYERHVFPATRPHWLRRRWRKSEKIDWDGLWFENAIH